MWFSVSILLKRQDPDDEENPTLWEETILLIDADSEDEAREKARIIGSNLEHSYESALKKAIKWEYEGVLSVYQPAIDTLNDGVEIFSRFLRDSEVSSLKNSFSD